MILPCVSIAEVSMPMMLQLGITVRKLGRIELQRACRAQCAACTPLTNSSKRSSGLPSESPDGRRIAVPFNVEPAAAPSTFTLGIARPRTAERIADDDQLERPGHGLVKGLGQRATAGVVDLHERIGNFCAMAKGSTTAPARAGGAVAQKVVQPLLTVVEVELPAEAGQVLEIAPGKIALCEPFQSKLRVPVSRPATSRLPTGSLPVTTSERTCNFFRAVTAAVKAGSRVPERWTSPVLQK